LADFCASSSWGFKSVSFLDLVFEVSFASAVSVSTFFELSFLSFFYAK